MELRHACSSLCLSLVLCCVTACSRAGGGSSPAVQPVEDVQWLMCTDNLISTDYSRYAFYTGLLHDEHIRLTFVQTSQTDLNRYLMGKEGGDTPTLVTLDYTDKNNRKLTRSPIVYPLSAYADKLPVPYEAQAHPYAAYGIAGGFTGTVACEGVYVNRHYLEAMGAETPHTLEDLTKLCTDFVLHREVVRELVASGRQAVPVVFGEAGQGLGTLQHLFGIADYAAGSDAPALHSPQLPSLTAWMMSLHTGRTNTSSLHLTGEEFYSVLNQQALLYIGSSSAIDRYHARYPDNPYVPVSLACAGYRASEAKYGQYVTYILHSSGQDTAVRVLGALLDEDAQRTIAYGQENVHYIVKGGQPERTEWVRKALAEDRAEFIAQSGILVFPYLLQGISCPYDTPAQPALRDITDERLVGQLDPSTAAGQAQISGETLFRSYCEALLTGGIGTAGEADSWLQRYRSAA